MEQAINGFDVFSSFMPGFEDKNDKDILDAAGEELTDEELKNITKTEKKEEIEEKQEKEDEIEDDDTTEESEDIEDIEEDIQEKRKPGRPRKVVEEEPINETDNESTMVTGFFDSLAEKLGWEEDEDNKPQSVEELINYFSEVIEENSKPDYASDEIEQLDKFVRQGGNLRDFFQIDAELDLDNIELEDDENNQKAVVREFLKEKGFNAALINKKINKYEDAGILEDEAEDALESLKEIKATKKEELLRKLQMQYEQNKKQQQQLYSDVVSQIKGLDTIRGIKVPEKDKKALIDYILKPDTDGKTKYYKDYVKGGVKNLIESAYFTMNADKLISAAEIKGKNKAIDRFRNSLRNTGISTKSKAKEPVDNDDNYIWTSAIRQLRMS